jgi:hypothetical protein
MVFVFLISRSSECGTVVNELLTCLKLAQSLLVCLTLGDRNEY